MDEAVMILTSIQIRTSRTLRGWNTGNLASASLLKLDVIDSVEGAEVGCLDAGQEIAIQRALERAGVDSIPDNASCGSVRLRIGDR